MASSQYLTSYIRVGIVCYPLCGFQISIRSPPERRVAGRMRATRGWDEVDKVVMSFGGRIGHKLIRCYVESSKLTTLLGWLQISLCSLKFSTTSSPWHLVFKDCEGSLLKLVLAFWWFCCEAFLSTQFAIDHCLLRKCCLLVL